MKIIFVFCCFIVLFQTISAQSFRYLFVVQKDSNYIENYSNDLIINLYSGEKSHSLGLNDLNNPYSIKYLPNGYYNLGLGVNYKWIGFSFATKVPLFLNSEIRKGETKRIGFQSYLYSGKFAIDFLSSYLKGYYLDNSYVHLNSFSKEKEYQRSDILSINFGLAVNYVVNNSKFSYKAAFSDTEKQKKSAGSILLGGSLFSYQTKADSAFVPAELSSDFYIKTRDLYKIGVLALNANLGYAYSLVFLKNGIFTASYILGTGYQLNSFEGVAEESLKNWTFGLKHTGRFGLGYRYNRYYARVSVIRSTQYTNLKYNDLSVGNGTNFMQVSLAKRFIMNEKNKKRPVE